MTPGPEFVLAGVRMKQLLSNDQTGGSFSLFENSSAGISKTPIHVHSLDDETLYVLEGEIGAILGGEKHLIRPGEPFFLPRGVPHQLMNESGLPARYLLLCTPGGFEGFLREGGHELLPGEIIEPPTAGDIERLKSAAPRFGITLLNSWP